MKNWLKKQFTLNPKNLKAIGVGFLWGIGVTAVLGLVGISIPAVGIFVWVVMSYRYQKKFKELKK